jgi:hypothetical protein
MWVLPLLCIASSASPYLALPPWPSFP